MAGPAQKTSAAQVVARIDQLNSLPESIRCAMAELNDRRSTSSSIAKAIESDPPLITRILRVANSGLYARGTRVGSVPQAISRLGRKEVTGIVTAAAMVSTFVDKTVAEMKDLYVHSAISGEAAKLIAKRSPSFDGEIDSLFTSSLLHDVGLFALLRFSPENVRNCVAHANTEKISLAKAEKHILGYDHAEVGSLLLQRWRLAEFEVNVAKWHHRPQEAPVADRQACYIIHLTDFLANKVRPRPITTLLEPQLASGCYAALGFEVSDSGELIDLTLGAIERATELASLLL